jgi:hypothetical protein
VGPADPAGQRLAGQPGPDLLAAADQLLERERAGPDGRQRDDGVPEMLTSHRQHQIRPGQIAIAERAGPVRGRVKAVGGQR